MKPAVLQALDALNSWCRAGDHWQLRSDLKQTIYHAKLEAIQAAYCAEDETVKPVFRRVFERRKCRVCAGSGMWFADYDYECEDGQPCRTCRASGTVTLRFVEITFPALNLRWHTPAHKWWSASLNVYCKFEASLDSLEGYDAVSDDWQSNLPGRELTLQEIDQHLGTCLSDPLIAKAFVFMLGTYGHRFTPHTLLQLRIWLRDRLLLAVSHFIRDRQTQPGYPHSITPPLPSAA